MKTFKKFNFSIWKHESNIRQFPKNKAPGKYKRYPSINDRGLNLTKDKNQISIMIDNVQILTNDIQQYFEIARRKNLNQIRKEIYPELFKQ